VEKHRKYAEDVLWKVAYACGADKDAVGFNRIFRNPFHKDAKSRITDTRIDLWELADLPTPPLSYRKRKKRKKGQYIPREAIPEFSDMVEGDGRNEAMFLRLRYAAYDLNNAGEYDIVELANLAFNYNLEFGQALEEKELNLIINSIDEYVSLYNRGEIKKKGKSMLTPEQKSERGRENGKKGGATTAKIRQAQAWARIHATITQMRSFDIKITVSEVARRAKSKPDTVRRLMKENDYREVSRKLGWYHKSEAVKI
jgi:hypothetical protein